MGLCVLVYSKGIRLNVVVCLIDSSSAPPNGFGGDSFG
jgi:hypothetical protein